MKKSVLMLLPVVLLGLTSCEKTETVTYDVVKGAVTNAKSVNERFAEDDYIKLSEITSVSDEGNNIKSTATVITSQDLANYRLMVDLSASGSGNSIKMNYDIVGLKNESVTYTKMSSNAEGSNMEAKIKSSYVDFANAFPETDESGLGQSLTLIMGLLSDIATFAATSFEGMINSSTGITLEYKTVTDGDNVKYVVSGGGVEFAISTVVYQEVNYVNGIKIKQNMEGSKAESEYKVEAVKSSSVKAPSDADKYSSSPF